MDPGFGKALVTGASSGIGAALAVRLARRGYDLVLVARRRDRLEEVAATVRRLGREAIVLPADLTSTNQRSQVEEFVAHNDLALLVNNAGFSGYGPFEQLDLGTIDQLIGVHVIAPARLTRIAVQRMLEQGSGGVINVGSLMAFAGEISSSLLPARTAYAGAKSFLLAFTRTLAAELKDRSVRVMVVLPGAVATEFQRSGAPTPQTMQSPEALADAIVSGYERGEVVCIPGLEDLALLQAFRDAERGLLMNASTAQMASRYGLGVEAALAQGRAEPSNRLTDG